MSRLAIVAALFLLVVGCGSGGGGGSDIPGSGGDPGGTDPGESAALSDPGAPFAERYADLIPPDVAIDVYDSKRFALVTGVVQDAGGAPLAGVRVALDPRYGSVTTDGEGRFTIPTEGGGLQRLAYSMAGLIASHRQVRVPWNGIAVAETVRMIPQDSAATTIALDGNPGTVLSHRSTPVSDAFGTRSATMVFTGDTKVFEVDADGETLRELSAVTVRATEFATPESMPAVLPPTSAYTYCAEMSIDGAQRVRFDKPVTSWVENFLGFEVGEAVPVGYYDRDRSVWVPSENGAVVRLLDTDSDGAVDALDADGDGAPDDLDSDGNFGDEVAGLNDPARYPPDASFWRFSVTHFTPWDCNWPIVPPEDATEPDPEEEPETGEQEEEEEPKPCGGKTKANSFVEDRSRVFHEGILIPGTDLSLHYASNRVEGYKTAIRVPASGGTVPESLEAIIVRVSIAGRSFERRLPPEPNQETTFLWDGLDHLGRPVAGAATARVRVGFSYSGFYSVPGSFERIFGRFGRVPTFIRARQEVILWKTWGLRIRSGSRIGAIAEGWTPSAHHQLNPSDPGFLLKGDGTVTNNNTTIIDTIAGSGGYGHSEDGSLATQLDASGNMVIDAVGNLFLSASCVSECGESPYSRVRKIDTDGIITTVAGNGTVGYSGDDGQATEAQLSDIGGLAVDAESNLYISDSYNNRIRKIDSNGIITSIAGNGTGVYGGDGGTALEAGMVPGDITIDASGNLYVSDWHNRRILKVDTGGIITTVAGNGKREYSGDGGAASEAGIIPWSIAVDDAGNLYIEETRRIRKVDTSGIITTVAGSGKWDFGFTGGDGGDGGPATEAQIWATDIATDAAGNLYIADLRNRRIRRVDSDGIIMTVAGNGTEGNSGDGGPATAAQIYAHSVAVDGADNIYITSGGQVRRLIPNSAFKNARFDGDIFFAEEGFGYLLSPDGRHRKTIDLDTGTSLREFAYNEEGNLTEILDASGNATRIEWAGGTPTAIVSADNVRTALSVDPGGHLARIDLPDGGAYAFEYSPEGLMTAETDPAGNRFGHVFDETGRLTEVTDPEGGHWTFEREAAAEGGVLVSKTTGEGEVTTYHERTDSAGAYTSTVTGPSGGVSLFSRSADGLSATRSLSCGTEISSLYGRDPEYHFPFPEEIIRSTPGGLAKETLRDKTYQDSDGDDLPNLITETVTVNGRATTLVTDTLQATKEVTSPSGRKVTTFYDPETLLTSRMTVPGLYDLDYGYDAKGHLTSLGQDARQTTFAYNAQGFLDSVTDPENRTTTYDHDAMGRVTGIHRPDSSLVRFTYDKNGNMTMLTNPSGVGHGFDYNGVDGNSGYQTPLSGSYRYLYDRDRRLTEIQFPSGRAIRKFYSQGRLDAIETPEGTVDYSYLCATKIGSVSKNGENLTYAYDGPLVTSEASSGALNQTLSYAYNNDFDITSFSYAGDTEGYSYDADGLLTGVGSFTLTRNAGNGLPESVSDGPFSLDRTFNGYGEVEGESVSVGATNPYAYNLMRDSAGRIVEKTEIIGGTSVHHLYTYDTMGRLLTVTRDDTLVEEYRYNDNGSRIYEMNSLRSFAGRALSYDEEDHLLTTGDTSYQFDLDGFLTIKTRGSEITRYNYSSRGELLSVNLPDGKIIEYVHDPQGHRIAKKVNGATIEKYLWQGLTHLLAVYDGSDSLLIRFEYADGRMPVSMTKGGTTYYLAFDQVGSLKLVVDSSGNVVKEIEYDSFGNILSDSNSALAVPFGFAGGLHDQAAGLVRFGYRDYDPEIGRWTAKDPIGFAGGDLDLYGYVVNNPINFIDPEGLRIGIGKLVKMGLIRLSKWLGGKLGDFIGNLANLFEPGIRHPPEQQDMEKDTDGDGLSDYFDTDDDNDGVPDEQDEIPKGDEEDKDNQEPGPC